MYLVQWRGSFVKYECQGQSGQAIKLFQAPLELEAMTWNWLTIYRCHYDLRKYSFTVRVTNAWNIFPESVVSADTIDTFKNRLDKFWKNQDMIYNYKSDLTGTDSRSLTNMDESITYCT